MEFGRVDRKNLAAIDFTLPPDPELTIATLKAAKEEGGFEVHVGCAKWGRKEWLGKIYPSKTKEVNFLNEYVKHFDCIELNATFYKVYGPDAIAEWKERATNNPRFKFCPKFSQTISHFRRLKNAQELTTQYYNGILAFGDQLGPLFLQLGENYAPKSFPELKAYLEDLPTDVPVFLEVRHRGWFSVKENSNALFGMLRDLHIGAVMTDASGRRDCVHMQLPTPHAFIRFVGNSLDKTDYLRVDDWVSRIKQWKAQGLQSVWFFMHQHDERYSPELCDYVVKKMNKALGLNLHRPDFTTRDRKSSGGPKIVR